MEDTARVIPFLQQVLPKQFKTQLKERGIDVKAETTYENRSEVVKKAFARYGVAPATRAEEKTFDYDMIIEEVQKETNHSKEVIMRAMTVDMHLLPAKYIESILSVMDNDFGNWFDAREFDDEYEG